MKRITAQSVARTLIRELDILGEQFVIVRGGGWSRVYLDRTANAPTLSDDYLSLSLLDRDRVGVIHSMWSFTVGTTDDELRRVAELVVRRFVEKKVDAMRFRGWDATGFTTPDVVGITTAEQRSLR